jgi:hypothetical protein
MTEKVSRASTRATTPRRGSQTLRPPGAEMAFCGQTDWALRTLRKSLELGYSIYPAMDTNPLFEAVRRDPRYAELRDAAIRYRDQLNTKLLEIDALLMK